MAESVFKSYDNGKIPVLRGASMSVKKGEIVALWGASGSGKSTLLHLIGGLDTPDSGKLDVCGLNPAIESDRLGLRREKVGFIFQLHNLIADLSVRENLLIPAIAKGTSGAAAAKTVADLLAAVGLTDKAERRVQALSGGERQRVAVCRSLVNHPSVVLADEPTGALDEKTGEQVYELLQNLTRERQVAVVIATHERRFANACDRVYRVREGICEPI